MKQNFTLKTNKYLIASFILFLAIICIEIITASSSPPSDFQFKLDKGKLLSHPARLVILYLVVLTYLIFLLVGTINLFMLIIKRLRRRPFINGVKRQRILPLSKEKAGMLLFSVTLLIFTIYIIEITLFYARIKSTIGAVLLVNLFIELGTITIITRFVPIQAFGFSVNNRDLASLFKLYTNIMPLILGIALISNVVSEKIGIESFVKPVIELLLSIKGGWLMSLLIFEGTVVAPIAEELFFRGILYKMMRRKYSFMMASVVISIFFALLHRNLHEIPPLFVISVALCYLYEKTQNIITPIIFHSLHNSLTLGFLLSLKGFMQ